MGDGGGQLAAELRFPESERRVCGREFAERSAGAGASIVVDAAEDWPYGAKQTLVELANGQTFSAAANNLAVTCTDDRLCVRRSTNSIYVYKPNGTMMIFR